VQNFDRRLRGLKMCIAKLGSAGVGGWVYKDTFWGALLADLDSKIGNFQKKDEGRLGVSGEGKKILALSEMGVPNIFRVNNLVKPKRKTCCQIPGWN